MSSRASSEESTVTRLPGVNWLSFARRDAAALHGLFTDSMVGETVLLTDEQATGAAIEEEFRKLEGAAPDDVVVVAFSGHGSETHELVAHDTDPYDIPGTSNPLTTLGEGAHASMPRAANRAQLLFFRRDGREGAPG